MRRYFRLLRMFVSNSIQLELEYRVNLLMNACNSLIAFGAGLIVLFVMFERAGSVGGWRFEEALALYGVFIVFEALIEILLYPNLNRLPEHIRTGTLDFMLLKPVSAQFLVSFRYASIWRMPEALLGLGIIVHGMATLGTLTPANLLLLAALLAAGGAIVYAIWFMLITTAFWFVKVENIAELFNSFFAAGRFPVTAFPNWARLLLTFVVPIAFVTTVPASAAIGRLDWRMGAAGVAMAATLLVCGNLFWRRAISSYTSASS